MLLQAFVNLIDNAIRFAPEDPLHVFEPFFSRHRKGIGLAIVRRTIDEHRTSIEAVNRTEDGAIVGVRLSLVTAEDEGVRRVS